jgi:hypothetical protein
VQKPFDDQLRPVWLLTQIVPHCLGISPALPDRVDGVVRRADLGLLFVGTKGLYSLIPTFERHELNEHQKSGLASRCFDRDEASRRSR